uniref:Spindle assembly checkpoint component MAD1 n=1 Tax=Macrostomum lignano TaxID=282301 RepID=A0A1I8F8A5_9PLAT
MASSSAAASGQPPAGPSSLRVTRSATQSPLNFLRIRRRRSLGYARALSEERLRSDQHRSNFQLLKAKHSQLQEQYANLERQLKTTLEESRAAQERLNDTLHAAKKERDDARAELEEAKLQGLNAQKLEMIKAQVTEDLELAYKDRYAQLFPRERLSSPRMEPIALRKRPPLAAILSTQKLSTLARERDFLLQRQADSDPCRSVRALYRENAQLLARLKALDSELEEARTGRDTEQQSAELRARTLERQLADCQSNVRQLNAERRTNRCVSNWTIPDGNSEAEKNAAQLRSRLEELEHKAKLEMYNAKLQWTQERGAIERERDSLLASETPWIESDSWPVESRLYEKKNGRLGQQIESEKIAAEGELQTARQKVAEVDSVIRAERERCQERVSRAESEAKASADERASLESRIERLERELRTQTEARDELESRLRRHEAEAAAAADTLDALEEAKSERLEAQRELRQVQLKQKSREFNRAKEEWRKKKHKYSAAVRSARERAELAEAKECELGAQSCAKASHTDEYNRVRKELRDLQRRLGDFRSVLMTSRAPEPGSASRELGIPGGKSRRRRRLERSRRRTSNGRVEKPIG